MRKRDGYFDYRAFFLGAAIILAGAVPLFPSGADSCPERAKKNSPAENSARPAPGGLQASRPSPVPARKPPERIPPGNRPRGLLELVAAAGVYSDFMNQNSVSVGMAIQAGVVLNLWGTALAVLGEARGGTGLPWAVELGIGGVGELSFFNGTLGLQMGSGLYGNAGPVSKEGHGGTRTEYRHYGLIFGSGRGRTRLNLYARHYADDAWGVGFLYGTGY